ncbi:PAS domain S-box protein [Hyalangium minutum]|uniref:histidine kinase n=1 Tax=Hyalangium minutum TaxID=394096 RepID=A0A085WKY7_9BACT|nr:PAS domain S-box protein [Hyalangium minutum]KFE68350.1 sensor histidine kinase/response regulator [Hyalangium minutum]
MSPATPASSPSERLSRQIIDGLKEGVFQTDPQGRWTFLNPAWSELTGFSVAESLGRDALESVHPEDRTRVQESFQALLAHKADHSRHELRYLRRDGSTLWVEMVTRPLQGEDGGLQGLCGTLTDVSTRRRTEEAMARRERYLSALVEMQQRLLMAQQEGDLYKDVLEPIGRAAGASRVYFFEVFRGEAGQQLMSQRAEWCAPGIKPVSGNPRYQPVVVDRDFKRWGELLSRGEVVAGRVKDFPVTERAILEPQGIRSMLVLPLRINNSWVGFIGFDHCESEQEWDKLEVDLLSAAAGALSLELEHRRSESALRERETRYRQLAENASDVQYRYKLEPPRAFLYISRVVGDRLGYSPEEHYANPELWRQLVHPGDLPALGQLLEAPHQLGSKPVVLRFTGRNGRTRWLEHTVAPVLDTTGRPVVVEGIARDITERREVEEQLKMSEASFRILLEGVADAAAIQRDGRIVYANMALVSALGFDRPDQLVGRTLAQFIEDDMEEVPGPPPDPSGIKGMITGERRLVRRDGKTRVAELVSLPLLFDGAPAVVSIARDVTDQRQFQARLTLADKLASVGTLAAGIAHEINNPLAFVISNLSFLSEEMRRSQLALETSGTGGVLAPALARPRGMGGGLDLVEWQEVLSEAYEGAERVRQIVRQLRAFSRPDEERLTPVDVHQVLESVVMMATNEIRHRAQLHKDFGPVPSVMANEGRLSQVFLHLVVNAAHAIPEGQAHQNAIRLITRRLDPGRVLIEVQDTGRGIAPEHLSRIFDPFFTTKPVNVGTGLGLSICHSTITSMGGEISVDSDLGKGTTFRVVLPSLEPRTRLRPTGQPTIAPLTHRRGRVLVVDDEPGVGKVLRRILKEHEVEVAAGGRQALERLQQEPDSFDAVLCDVMMPDLGGKDLYEAVRRTHSGLERRFIFVSGGAFTANAREFLETIPNPKLEKPFNEPALRQIVQELVSRGPSSTR